MPNHSSDQNPLTGADGALDPWEREVRARSWWASAEERDGAAALADQTATDRDTAARTRDADALDRDHENRTREEWAYQRIREVTRRLNDLDAQELDRHVRLQQAQEAMQEAIDSGTPTEPLMQLLRQVQKLLDMEAGNVVAAADERSTLRADLRHAGQHLAAAADERGAAGADRAGAAVDRAAAAHERDSARTARHQAAAYRTNEEPGHPIP